MCTEQPTHRLIHRISALAAMATCLALVTPTAAIEPAAPLLRWDADLRFRVMGAKGLHPLTSTPTDRVRGVYQRLRLGAQLKRGQLSCHLQLQSSGTFGANGPGDPPAPLGLQLGYLRFQPARFPNLALEVGRMAMSFGSGRHISDYDFHREGNAYDGVRARYASLPWLKIDGFAVKLRRNTAQPDKERNLYGIYVAGQPTASLTTDVYLLELRDQRDGSRSEFRTFGARADWRPAQWAWLEVEAAAQIGEVQQSDAKAALPHFATAINGVLGLKGTLGRPIQAALYVDRYSMQSGPNPDESRAWIPLYPDLYRHTGLQRVFQPAGVLMWGGWLRVDALDSLWVTLRSRSSSVPKDAPLPGEGKEQTTTAGDNPRVALGVQLEAEVTWRVTDSVEFLLAGSVLLPGRELATLLPTPSPTLVLLQWRGRL